MLISKTLYVYILLLCINYVCSAGPTTVFIVYHSVLSSQQIKWWNIYFDSGVNSPRPVTYGNTGCHIQPWPISSVQPWPISSVQPWPISSVPPWPSSSVLPWPISSVWPWPISSVWPWPISSVWPQKSADETLLLLSNGGHRVAISAAIRPRADI